MLNRRPALSCLFAVLTLIASVLVTGCGMGTPAAPTPGGLSGRAIGGNSPIVGAHVYLLAASNAGFGDASISLLGNNGSTVQTDPTVTCPDATGTPEPCGYVLTGTGGYFSLTGDYKCNNSTDQVYILITGGNPGLSDTSADNSALALIAALGPCGYFNGSSTLTLNPSTTVIVNEVTTVAAVYALSQFMTDAMHVGSSSTDLTGLANAFVTASTLANANTGIVNTTVTQTALNVSKTVTVPHDEINYLADVLVDCVNSDGSGSSPCPGLYSAANNCSCTDTVQAMLAIARTPAAEPEAVYNYPTGGALAIFPTAFAPPAAPPVTTPPTPPTSWDWSMLLTYTSGNNDGPLAVIDGSGAIWSVNSNSSGNNYIVGMSNNGTPLTPATGSYTSASFISAMAFDLHNDLWFAETDFTGMGNSDVAEIDPATVSNTPLQVISGAGTGLNQMDADPGSLVIDGSNNIWLWLSPQDIFSNTGSVDMLSANNSYQAASGFPSTSGGFNNDYNLSNDASGNLWAGGQIAPGLAGIQPDGTGILGAPFSSTTSSLIASQAIDASGNICYIAGDPSGESTDVIRISQLGNVVSTYSTTAPDPFNANQSTQFGQSVLIDGRNTAWLVLNSGQTQSPQLQQIDPSGNLLQSVGTAGTEIIGNTFIDSSGNLWISFQDGAATPTYTMNEYVGVAAPVTTPTSVQLNDNLVGQLPAVPAPI